MSKVLKDTEILEIIRKTIETGSSYPANKADRTYCIDGDDYMVFMEKLADAVCAAYGGTHGDCDYDACDDLEYTVAFHIDENVASDGGPYRWFDTDVIWHKGEEK